MGSSQSTQNHNRLSKPKTNTNSPNPALVPLDSPNSVSSRHAGSSVDGMHQVPEALLSPVSAERDSVIQPNRAEESKGEPAPRARGRSSTVASRTNSRSNSKTNSRSNSLFCFGSRHGSSTKLFDLHGQRIPQDANGDVDIDQAIRLLHEAKRNGSPEHTVALHGALDQFDAGGLGCRNSMTNRSSSSLTRRRSLIQTPGVATRNYPLDDRWRSWNSWRPPTLAPEEEAKWTPSHKVRSATNRGGALGLVKDEHKLSSPTVQTPRELPYSHLGSLKLGTLSIVNGAPSPAPSTKAIDCKTQSVVNDDYFSTDDIESSPLTMKTTRRHGHVKSKSATASLPTNSSSKTQIDKPSGAKRAKQTLNTDPALMLAKPPQTADRTRLSLNIEQASELVKRPQTVDRSELTTDVAGRYHAQDEVAAVFTGTLFDAPHCATEALGPTLFPASPSTLGPKGQTAILGPRPEPRKADSGYSSGGSLQVGSSRSGDACIKEQSTANSHPRRPGAQGPVARPKPITYYSQSEQNRPPPLVLLDQTSRSSTSENIVSPLTPHSITSRASFDSTHSATHRRLQRRKTSQTDVPVIQSCQPIPEGNIPDVPSNVRAAFTRRLSHTPEMECLTQTYSSKEYVDISDLASGASTTPPARVAPLAELEAPHRPMTRRRRSLSLFRRRSVAEKEVVDDNVPVGVVDLGDIASSLGSSPYDAAMSGNRRSYTMTAPTHPHQLGATLPRAKSMVGMGDEAAAEYARMHSRDRALVDGEQPQRQRKSHHGLGADFGEARAFRRRPQSAVNDIPPVPAIDTSKLKAPLSARLRLESEAHSKTPADISSKYQSVDWSAHSLHWSQRRKSTGEALRTHAGFSEATAFSVNTCNVPQLPAFSNAWGRYNGGLEYNYERGAGIGGSAGTHAHTSQKSMHWKNQYGVDLTDVPIMLQRVA